MPMRLMSKRERTTALRSSTPLNSSGTWPIPYGKGVITLSGRGGTGTAGTANPVNVVQAGTQYYYVTANGYNYTAYHPGYNYTAYHPGYNYTVYTQGYNQTVLDQPGYTATVVDTPGSSGYTYASTTVYQYQTYYAGGYTGYNYNSSSNTSHSCPSPYSSAGGYFNYSCTDNYTAYSNNPNYKQVTYNPNYKVVTNNPTNNPVYQPPYYSAEYQPPYYTTEYQPPTYASAYNNPNYNTSYTNPNVKGDDMIIAGITFPGGDGGAGAVVNATVQVPYSNSGLAITIPTGGYVNIVVST